jgi:hypothetical protein
VEKMRQELELARELIEEKQYDKARMLLRKVQDDPLAQKWLEKLDSIAPQVVVQPIVSNGSSHDTAGWQYAALEVKRSYGIQYKFNGENRPEWKDQPIYYCLNEVGKEGWELVGFESIAEFSTYLLKKQGANLNNQKIDVWDQ